MTLCQFLKLWEKQFLSINLTEFISISFISSFLYSNSFISSHAICRTDPPTPAPVRFYTFTVMGLEELSSSRAERQRYICLNTPIPPEKRKCWFAEVGHTLVVPSNWWLPYVLDLTIAALGVDGYRTIPNLNGAISRKLLRQFVRARNVASEHTAFYSYCGLLVHQGYNSGTYNYRMQQKSRRLLAQLCILKMKIVKNPLLVLLHCIFTMYRPRMYSMSQWWSQHRRPRLLMHSKRQVIHNLLNDFVHNCHS